MTRIINTPKALLVEVPEGSMETKFCTKCKIEKDLTAYHKMKAGKHGVRSTCKDCNRQYRKAYEANPEFKKRKRERMSEWRKENHDRALEISRKCWNKNSAKYNEKKRWLYQNDEEYRNKKVEADKKYKASGRRNEMNRRNPKHRERAKKWAKENPERVRQKMSDYRKRVWNKVEKCRREKLDDTYVVKVIKIQSKNILKTEEIPKGLIDLKKQSMKLKRELKNKDK